jgi:hypothetical protein
LHVIGCISAAVQVVGAQHGVAAWHVRSQQHPDNTPLNAHKYGMTAKDLIQIGVFDPGIDQVVV